MMDLHKLIFGPYVTRLLVKPRTADHSVSQPPGIGLCFSEDAQCLWTQLSRKFAFYVVSHASSDQGPPGNIACS